MAGYKDFADGATLDAADVNGYLMLQTEMRFTTATARNTALSAVLTEGLRAYTTSDSTRWLYDGSAWQPWDTNWKVWTPTINNFTLGNGKNAYRYRYRGGDLEVYGKTTLGTESSVDGTLTIDLPNSETSNSAAFSQGILASVAHVTGEEGVGVAIVKASATTINMHSSGGYDVWDATDPQTWAVNDWWILTMRVRL